MDGGLAGFTIGLISGAISGVFASFLVWFLIAKTFASKLKFANSIKRRTILEDKKAASIKLINRSQRVAFRVAIFARLHIPSERENSKWDHYKIYFNKRSVDHEVAFVSGGRNAVLNLHFLDSYGIKQSVRLKEILADSKNNQEFIEKVFDRFPGSFIRLLATSYDGFTNSFTYSFSSDINCISDEWMWKQSRIAGFFSKVSQRRLAAGSFSD